MTVFFVLGSNKIEIVRLLSHGIYFWNLDFLLMLLCCSMFSENAYVWVWLSDSPYGYTVERQSYVWSPKVSFLNEQCFNQCFIKVHRTFVSVHFFFLIQGQLESRTVKFKITKVPMLSVSWKLLVTRLHLMIFVA